jgi:hypothetical protein
MSGTMAELDLIEELRLRRWARENYVPPHQRQDGWHWIVLDEMTKKEGEGSASNSSAAQSAWLKS